MVQIENKTFPQSHEIKKNDLALAHMGQNMQGRTTFLATIGSSQMSRHYCSASPVP